MEALDYIDPAELEYQEWVNVGMALKQEGYSVSDWDNWSKSDRRYHNGECEKKWESFNGSSSPVTAGTIIQMAKERGMTTQKSKELSWDDEINFEIGYNGEGMTFSEPDNWNPVSQIITYLETLFEASENVGYVTETYEKTEDGITKYLPTRGSYDRTAGELIELLNICDGDIGAVFGDYKEEAGAWIRFNPLDGKGVKNENVTDFRYALVESDCMTLEEQNALIRELELPVAIMVYTGGKSIHAIVKVDAPSYDEYRKRVDYLYGVCKKNGLEIDRQCRNPSRLSRMPGVIRNGKKQYIIDRNIGKSDFAEWKDWIESINDDLPDPESLSKEWDDLPELSPPLIDGVLRQGHKMLLGGPSKAGKSFGLIELSIAIAEGAKWFGFQCTQGRVMYVNLELDRASCLHRFKDVYTAMQTEPKNIDKIDIWNLRGKSIPMDKLAPKLIRRAAKKDYIAIIIDPIYKVITGDENSADQMAHFCNQFDKVCTELGCAVVYCHHHSKGTQGNKRSMDRVSGSGVFARDPDALLDLTELEITDTLRKQQEDEAICKICADWIGRFNKLDDVCSQDDRVTPKSMLEIAHKSLHEQSYSLMMKDIETAKKAVQSRTAWRIEGTLREFPKFPPLNLWFDYPIHRIDDVGVLKDCEFEGDNRPSWQKATKKHKESAKNRSEENRIKFENALNLCNMGEAPTVKQVSEYLDMKERTVRDWIKKYGYVIDRYNNTIIKNENGDGE
ncbi:MAG: AAA family ATPase [Ruminococcus sp.]|nr:AAA family ATPase [Ruminococcus sp.]